MSRHRRLALELSKRELLDRYAGQFFGAAWALFHPALTVLVFLFLFGEVLKLKISGTNIPPNVGFTTYLLAGLLPWLVLQDVMGRGATLITSQAHLVKQVAFPLDVLPIKSIPPAFVILLVGLILLAGYTLVFVGPLPWTYIMLPLLISELAIICVGVALLLSAVGVFVRDLKDFVQIFTFVGIYVSPIIYTIDAIPSKLRLLIMLNPFTSIILVFQDALFYGAFIHPWAWVISALLSLAIFLVGARVFYSTQHFFGSYL
ncbi:MULTISPECIES: ABC transporter permease [Bradyrhizobium]|nr:MULTISPECIES: ABC transporter permease [Bradyrhizobium]